MSCSLIEPRKTASREPEGRSEKSKVVNSREVREVVEGTTCISDKKLSKIC